MITTVFFLGNPGREYRDTRHNLAWLLLAQLPEASELSWQRRHKGESALCRLGSSTIFLHKPLTFMNKSGESISEVAGFFKTQADQILIVHDEVELQCGEIGLKFGGGLSGHNGLRSASQHLGTKDFYRLRIGIGRPSRGDVSSFVLGKITEPEKVVIHAVFDAAGNLLREVCTQEPEELLQRYRRYLVT
ncbi:MAG: aminoacyl-tRNA hydrolase [Spirochaetales bacterium]|nr:aminoacyl-tRNA hydrolase [Spirochaetales bacterium]